MKPDDLAACVVRVEDAEGRMRGTGFLVRPDLAVTCAHVVKAAGAGPGDRVRLAFHAGGEPVEAEVLPDGYHPDADVAFLRIAGPLPERVAPAVLGASKGQEGAAVRSFGYPSRGDVEGLWGTGELAGRVTEAGRALLQLRSGEITAGFSGGPVWDVETRQAIGMVTQIATSDRYGRLGEVAFAIPAETLRDLCPNEITLQFTETIAHAGRLPFHHTPFQAPPLPRHFVPRPEVSEPLKIQLLAEHGQPSGILVVSAIHGLGGIGKSTLAAALVRDPEVLTRFPDGILWATLGQQPDVLSLLTGWIQALGDYDFRPTTSEAATAHLRTLLHDKAALLVVDDAWDPAHVHPFLAGGDRCRVLVTTREAVIASAVGAKLYDLDVMTPAQALALLGGRLGRKLEGEERASARELARVVGYLPLALELAAAQVADGVPWDELLEDLDAEIARLETLEVPGAEEVADEALRKQLSLKASFHLSLRRLSAERRTDFAWLGVLPEDVVLTPAMMATVWGKGVREARDTLRYLRGKALLSPGAPRPDGTPTYRLHDLLHDLARRLLTAPPEPKREGDLPGLGVPLPEAHRLLLERYRARTQDGLWHTLPDGGYIHAHLTWHMEQAGEVEAIHALLREETEEGRNGWYEARERLGQTAGYLADIACTWQLAEEEIATRNSLLALGLQCRYALITASLNTLAKNIPPALLAALVWQI